VFVTTTGVGGRDVWVASAWTTAVGVCAWGIDVLMVGGLPLAGSLQPAVINDSPASKSHVRMIFLPIIASFEPNENDPRVVFYIISRDTCLSISRYYGVRPTGSGAGYPDGSSAFERAIMLTNTAADAQIT
jgi:hypothetical protein